MFNIMTLIFFEQQPGIEHKLEPLTLLKQ